MNASKTLITIVGPTASGKTSLAVEVASHYKTEIISADSRQVYKELHIGVAKPNELELNAVPHHFIGSVSIHDTYSAGRYAEEATAVIQRLFETHDIVVMVGGSGLYINAVLEGMDELPGDIAVRQTIRAMYDEKGITALQEELLLLDPEYHQKVDLSNPHRLMRAIEVSRITKQPYSEFLTGHKKTLPFEVVKIGLTAQRDYLYDRVNQRVDQMIEAGLVEEVRGLFAQRHLTALHTVGYNEIFDHIDGKQSLDSAIEKIKQHTRQYAKRQLTWWRRDAEVQWAAIDQGGQLLSFVKGIL